MIVGKFVAVALIGYLLGSVPFGVLIARRSVRVDIREVGSGRTGTTNVLRTAGRKAAVLVAVLDLLKGALPVIFAGLIFHGLRIICGITNRFGLYMAVGILLLISTQALVNIAVVVGLAPTKGLPLPFISSGGSSMIALMMSVGLFLNIARHPKMAAEGIRDDIFETWIQRIFSAVHDRNRGREK